MARARNIKPSFFMNEDLAELDFGVRLLFIGLWTLADREGRLEDRPKRIKRELFPSDTIDVDEGLAQLARFGFIDRYSVEEFNLISICKFVEHQKPHGTEKDSKYPDANGLFTVHERGNNGYVTGKAPENKRMDAGSNGVLTVKEQLSNDEGIVKEQCDNALNVDLLNPDLLNPECGIMNPENKTPADSGESSASVPDEKPKPSRKQKTPDGVDEVFEYWRTVMGKTGQTVLDSKRKARIVWAIGQYGVETSKRAIDGCKASAWHMGENDKGQRYDDLTLIFRDASKVENFLEIANAPPKTGLVAVNGGKSAPAMSKLSQSNAANLQAWLDRGAE